MLAPNIRTSEVRPALNGSGPVELPGTWTPLAQL
ncbi:hypothetical protein ACVWZX_004626 [Deinococcus sp. UYEF24]